MIQTFAGMSNVYGAPTASGQTCGADQEPGLFAVIGTSYGSSSEATFDYPNLDGRVAVGGAPGATDGPTLAMTWMISVEPPSQAEPDYQGPLLGTVALFSGDFAPEGWAVCNGQQLEVADFGALFAVIGSTFGGDGQTSFALPDLSGATAVGAGSGRGGGPVALGERTEADGVAALGRNYLICTQGVYPGESGDGGFPPIQFFTGQVIAYAGTSVPQGWAMANGALQVIENNQALFSLLGTTYGGDGTVTFALPDLRSRAVAGLAPH